MRNDQQCELARCEVTSRTLQGPLRFLRNKLHAAHNSNRRHTYLKLSVVFITTSTHTSPDRRTSPYFFHFQDHKKSYTPSSAVLRQFTSASVLFTTALRLRPDEPRKERSSAEPHSLTLQPAPPHHGAGMERRAERSLAVSGRVLQSPPSASIHGMKHPLQPPNTASILVPSNLSSMCFVCRKQLHMAFTSLCRCYS